MRTSPAFLATLIAASLAAAQELGEPPPFEIALEPPPQIEVGDRAEIVVLVRLGPSAATPMLLTPFTEGTAIEVVRGRLTGADGQPAGERDVRFRIPFVARAVGTSVFRLRLDGFACRQGRCVAVQIERSIALDVAPEASR